MDKILKISEIITLLLIREPDEKTKYTSLALKFKCDPSYLRNIEREVQVPGWRFERDIRALYDRK